MALLATAEMTVLGDPGYENQLLDGMPKETPDRRTNFGTGSSNRALKSSGSHHPYKVLQDNRSLKNSLQRRSASVAFWQVIEFRPL